MPRVFEPPDTFGKFLKDLVYLPVIWGIFLLSDKFGILVIPMAIICSFAIGTWVAWIMVWKNYHKHPTFVWGISIPVVFIVCIYILIEFCGIPWMKGQLTRSELLLAYEMVFFMAGFIAFFLWKLAVFIYKCREPDYLL